MQHLKPLRLSVFFFALACERTFIKKLALNLDVIGPEIILFPGASIHAFFFCPEMLQTGAVKGLSPLADRSSQCTASLTYSLHALSVAVGQDNDSTLFTPTWLLAASINLPYLSRKV